MCNALHRIKLNCIARTMEIWKKSSNFFLSFFCPTLYLVLNQSLFTRNDNIFLREFRNFGVGLHFEPDGFFISFHFLAFTMSVVTFMLSPFVSSSLYASNMINYFTRFILQSVLDALTSSQLLLSNKQLHSTPFQYKMKNKKKEDFYVDKVR